MAVYKITPTKANLMKVQSMLLLMKSSYELLDKKRVVLLREAAAQRKKKEDLENCLSRLFVVMQAQLDHATVAMGQYRLDRITEGMSVDESLQVQFRSDMGVEIPRFYRSGEQPDSFGFDTVHITLDYAMASLESFRGILMELASVTDAADRLEQEMRKTQKRANALEKVQIPKFQAMERLISQSLEEKEREEFFRLKLLKKKKARKKKERV